ncbi:helix-turn-helix transcriptional regulator [Streptacidiphilus monticola]|uniref:Helix-turn-helix transcriptional regulator n=1 Tax=Streptacidiphilus monticola TaxID=2161674 RepID=A0ABW1G4P3_9ACTN
METLLAQGRTEDAWKLAQEYRFGPPFSGITVIPDAPTLYGRLLLARGETDDGIRQLEEAGAQLDRRGWQNPLWAPWKGLLAQALAAKEPARARRLALEGRTRAERLGINSAIGVALRDSAAVAAGAEEELDLLRESVEKLGQSPAAYEYAVSMVAYGSALRRSGRAEEAAEYLDQAERDAVRLGAQAVAERARNERLATGVPQSPSRQRGIDDLTEQERLVAMRTAHGQDIGQIAAENHMSIRVVRMLLASVHHKLGIGPDGLRSVFGGGDA